VNFCSKCGGSLRLQPVLHDRKERLVCQSCGAIAYLDPKVSACTIPIIDGRVVLVKRAIEPGKGLWVIPGGYMDRGETLHQAAIRETLEEVNLHVTITDLVGVYSYPTSIVVVAVFACEVVSGTLCIDHESEEVRTFAVNEIPWDTLAFSSTRDALTTFFARSRV
jgi:ADP-ribose pyrophosphatase YjhB (NUDIX family)